MFKLTEHLKKDVKEFIEEVARKTKGYDVYLGGGFFFFVTSITTTLIMRKVGQVS